MNLKAKQLGCTGTHFNNPNGLPDELHYTTASDMAKIARAAWYNPTFRKYATTTYYEIPPTNKFAETRYLLNHHKMMKGNTYAYEGVMGGKTGYTDAAGNTLVTYAKRGNMRLVSVVMKSINGAYADTAALLDYGFNNFTRTAVKTEPATMSVSYLPAEKYILKDYNDCILCRRYQVPSVTLPNGTDISALNSSRSLRKNSVGLPILEITYSFNGQKTGCAKYYFKPCCLTGLFHLTHSLFCFSAEGVPFLTEFLRFFFTYPLQSFYCIKHTVIGFPDADLSLYTSMLLAYGNAFIYSGIINKPSQFPFCRKMAYRTPGTGHLPVLYNLFPVRKLSGNIFVIGRIRNINFLLFIFWRLIRINRIIGQNFRHIQPAKNLSRISASSKAL